MEFDRDIGRRGTDCTKWDQLQTYTGVDPEYGLAMWVADSDFATAPCVIEVLRKKVEHGAFGYGFDEAGYRRALTWWMEHRHGWQVDPDWIVTTQGLGHAIATVFDTWTGTGDGVCFFTPVYHEFRLKTERAERRPYEIPMRLVNGRYVLDFDVAGQVIDETVKVLIFCAPQNPSGRVWTAEEMRAVAAFCEKHDLILISDEVHADLVYPGARHIPMDVAAPEFRHRTITLNAASKTFNLPGFRTGQAYIPDPVRRAAFQHRLRMLDYTPGSLGIAATATACSPAGAEWVEAQVDYLGGNRAVFDAGVNAIPGVWSMPLQATYLAWVDFSGTGMTQEEINRRIRNQARIGVNHGPSFGVGGAQFSRFNLAMPRHQIKDAVARMQSAFADLQ
ncbi:MAG: putative C-S lyase [Rhodobacteraceae bacterium]|nr:putative C-S lyase [Paracoccaceae bacterium]